jgi:hypothetical protein
LIVGQEEPPKPQSLQPDEVMGAMCIIAVPEQAYQELMKAARKRRIGVSELLGIAISEYLVKT